MSPAVKRARGSLAPTDSWLFNQHLDATTLYLLPSAWLRMLAKEGTGRLSAILLWHLLLFWWIFIQGACKLPDCASEVDIPTRLTA